MNPKQSPQSQLPRRPKTVLSTLTTNHFHLRNPFMTAWLSATFPGFGHLSLGNYVMGIILFVWEMLANTSAKVNLVLLHRPLRHGEGGCPITVGCCSMLRFMFLPSGTVIGAQ